MKIVVIGTGLIGSKTIVILRLGRAHERSIPAAAQEQIIAPGAARPARSRS
jgi:malate/lactate dehydrogenase